MSRGTATVLNLAEVEKLGFPYAISPSVRPLHYTDWAYLPEINGFNGLKSWLSSYGEQIRERLFALW